MFLSDMKLGERAAIEGFDASCELREYAASMGMLRGVTVTLLAQSGGDLVVRVMNARIALGRELAGRIRVSPDAARGVCRG